MTTFYLGTHRPTWLAHPRIAQLGVPLFVSRTTLAGRPGRRITERRSLPRATTRWALDSGGFSELDRYGRWTITPREYVAEVRLCVDEIGSLDWAAPQDWMTEERIVAKTGLGVAEHQRRTVDNYLLLRDLAPDLPFVPVIQGQSIEDYQRCVDLYDHASVDLTRERLVGIGSVCRRQGSSVIAAIVATLSAYGLSLHGFGVKTLGISRYAAYLASADSMAWSYDGRRTRPGCTSTHASEANCMRFALDWYDRLLAALDQPQQLDLFGAAA